ncbi:beta-ketoacyl synthase N-terminal-like domain-containing protein [Pontibacter sp. MBLB2868]|uniref:beta-ketoacyl synthase N-terminal-like domain-containing protein n=1 Tax=Pontibacter sp. MBLB2868 TaxID=3451555 RepID=UPI003F74C53B
MADRKKHIVISGTGSISPLGHDLVSVSQGYALGQPAFTTIIHNGEATPVARLLPAAEAELLKLTQSNPFYNQLDRSVLLAIYAARQSAITAGWFTENSSLKDDLAVNIGSSRGATGLFEHHYDSFQQSSAGRVSSSASPTTTLGNLSSWVAQAVNAGGGQISHSMTCSTALMAVANGVAWLKAGMANRFLAGGTEAPLTPFTIAQMKAVGIYSKLANDPYPCQPYAIVKQNTFVLGEGAAVFAMEQKAEDSIQQGTILVEAVGLGFEKIESKTGISSEGLNFQRSMRHALEQLPKKDRHIDLIITHTPGTRVGDSAELAAIKATFGIENTPLISTNKWLIGHTLGASGALSLEYALHALQTQQIPSIPYSTSLVQNHNTSNLTRVLINAAGFGGNATSVILKKL